MKGNVRRIAITALCAVFAICGICSPLMAQEGAWHLVKITASSSGYALEGSVKELPVETRERKGISWQYGEASGVRRVEADVAFSNLAEVIPTDHNVIALDVAVKARLSGAARQGRDYVHFKCDAIVRSASGYEDKGFEMPFDYRVNTGSSKDISCSPRIANTVPKENYVLEFKLLFDDSGNRFRSKLRADSGDVTFLFHYKWRETSTGTGATTTSENKPSGPQAVFNSIRLEQNANWSGQKGMAIHLNFDVAHALRVPCTAYVYFYYDDANNTPLQTIDPYYKTQDGKMFYSTNFTPGYESATFEDKQLFIRYSAFWLQRGTHNLKFRVALYNNQTKSFMATSEWQRFQLVQK